MTVRVARMALAALAALGSLLASAQERVAAPARNPFDRPAFMVGARDNGQPVEATAPAMLELRATLVTAGRALANINGEILAVGDSYAGHRVVHVEEGRAIVIKGGERLVLDVYERQTNAAARRNQ